MTEELPILGAPLFCLHDGSGHGLSTTPCFVDGLDPSRIALYGPGFQATIMLHFRNGTGGLDHTTLVNTFVFISDGFLPPSKVDICRDWRSQNFSQEII